MERYGVKVIGRKEVAKDTLAFQLSKPESFSFKPGQYIQVFLPAQAGLSDDSRDSHTFSIAAAPHEDFLMFATRMREHSSFKTRLGWLHDGDALRIEGPGGSFVLPREEGLPVVYLVGGIGVTPVRSILKHMEHRQSERPVTLFYSNRNPEDAAFLEELKSVRLPNYTFILTMTTVGLLWETEGISDGGRGRVEKGYIDEPMIQRYVKDIHRPMFYVVGPPRFVESMLTVLEGANVPSTHIKSEDFTGY